MTATPIPRTLSLTAYGDLDATVLRELPKGRRPVETFVVDGARARARAYERIREENAAGRQCFVVCPLVEESEALQAKAATAEFERLRTTEFADLRVELIHGQMPSKKKAAAMEQFAGGDADVLVATSVIEVGIDVANATVMLIEHPERFGLAQLHQLRGRVGRGAEASYCILLGDVSPETKQRLDVFVGSESFLLANMRGGGAGCISATANVNPGPIDLLYREWQSSDAQGQQDRLNAIRKATGQYIMIPALKQVIAHYANDPTWSTVRPPLTELTAAQAKKVIDDLDKLGFKMPGLAEAHAKAA
jgi:hypothetical protein